MTARAASLQSKFTCTLCSLSVGKSLAGRRRLFGTLAPTSLAVPSPSESRKTWRAASTSTAAPGQSRKERHQKEGGLGKNEWAVHSADNAHLVGKAQTLGHEILSFKGIPSEEATLKALKVIEFAASQLTRSPTKQPPPNTSEMKATPALPLQGDGILSLDSKPAHPMSMSISIDLLSSLAYKILQHPPVFLTSQMLSSYVTIQSTLHRPDTIPEIFQLFARKPVPIPDSSPIRYRDPNPNAAKQAVPQKVADRALTAAIEGADLHLALSIIETTYATPAFQSKKFLIKAAPGLAVMALAPAAALVLAIQIPQVTNIADPQSMTFIATACILTYVGGVSTLGFVAITTSNDQMERVTWVTGTPLRARWLREEERAALDRVAMAWGFKDNDRRGYEEGQEWEELKEWCGVRSMILDRVSLMEGME